MLGECKRYLKGMYADVMAMFRYYSAFDQVKEPFAMVWGDFTEIMQNCDVADSKTCKLTVRCNSAASPPRVLYVRHATSYPHSTTTPSFPGP